MASTVGEDIVMVDASGKFGWGAFHQQSRHWVSGDWSEDQKLSHVVNSHASSPLFEAKGLVLSLWSLNLRDRNITVYSDSSVVVGKYQQSFKRFDKIDTLNEAMLALCVVECLLNVKLTLIHISGADNVFADQLSRGELGRQEFRNRANFEGWSADDYRLEAISLPLRVLQLTPRICW